MANGVPLVNKCPKTVVLTAHIRRYAKNPWIIYFKWVNCMVYKLYFNKAIFINKDKIKAVSNKQPQTKIISLSCLFLFLSQTSDWSSFYKYEQKVTCRKHLVSCPVITKIWFISLEVGMLCLEGRRWAVMSVSTRCTLISHNPVSYCSCLQWRKGEECGLRVVKY